MVQSARATGSPQLPVGTVTFLFSDIEGSTRLLQSLGDGYRATLERHQAILRDAFGAEGGVEVATEGDSFFVVFSSAVGAVRAAAAAQRALDAEAWPDEVGEVRVRMGLHTGEGTLGGDNYVGLDVHRAARIGAAAHGGQVLLSDATRALVVGSLPPELQLRELGEHRLKDLDEPERLMQLLITGLADLFPPPRSMDAPSNLPPQLTTFVGRQHEADEVAALLREGRLVTLTGPGGTGKTRLSLQVAAHVGPELGGAVFVDLSMLADAALIPTTIATALGLREEPKRSVIESVRAHLKDQRRLLVLDNFEQLQAGAPLVADLLASAPGLAVMVTSREVLHLRGEHEYPVPPLRLPDLAALPPVAALSQYDAVALFIQRAKAVRPDFAVDDRNAPAVAGICAHLDGLPLAIELAAARVKILSPEAILGRLEKSLSLLTSTSADLTERQRTLRGAIDWSHDLLGPAERVLFRRLGIFVGGCSIGQAEAICTTDDRDGDMLDLLASLVDKSLVRQVDGPDGEPRFGMLETIREYALERLTESADWDTVRRSHEDFFAALADEAAGEIMGAGQAQWSQRLEADRDNLRAATQRLADDGRIGEALQLGASMWRFWQQRGNLAEGRAVLDGLLTREDAGEPTVPRARALSGLGGLAYWQSDMEAASRAYDEGLAIARGLDDPAGLAEALYNVGYVRSVGGEHAAARELYEEALEIATRIGDQAWVMRLQEGLAFLLFHMGDYEPARRIQEQNVAVFRAAGQSFRIATGSGFLSYLEALAGRYELARSIQREALGIFRAAGDQHWVVRVLMIAGASAVVAGDMQTAARLNGAYDHLREPLGDIATPIQTLKLADPAVAARQALGDEAFERAYAAGRAMSLDEVAALLG